MCDYFAKLIVWLDGELGADEAAVVERHVRDCRACREQVGEYRKISKWVDAYCDAALAARGDRVWPAWASVISASAAAVALFAVFLLVPRKPAAIPAVEFPVASAIATAAPGAQVAVPHAALALAKKKIRRLRPSMTPENSRDAEWRLAEPAIQVAIPADEMFAPGAVPEGLEFVANVSIASDGSFGQLRPPASSLP